jgi:DtxR family transcriptional regulator, Mn-dependent transcriptional regulator
VAGQRNQTVVEDCLKAIFSVGEWDERGRTNSEVAARLSASASTVSELVRRLTDDGLVEHERYGAIGLTDAGLRQALSMVRRHRLIETYLVETLGYSWDEVHDEAEVLEHAISDRLLARMDRALGHPWRDPHGDAIPTPDGLLHRPDASPLASMAEDESGWVARILDEEPELLRWFDAEGITLDTRVTVVGNKPFGGALTIAAGDDGHRVDLGIQAVASLWISPTPPSADPLPGGCHYATCHHVGTS